MSIAAGTVKHLPANGGRAFALMGSSLTFKYEPDDNGDALMLFEHRMPPTLSVPPHTEQNHEAFYVLEGTLEIEVGGGESYYRLGPGDFLSIRPGVLHALHNPGPGTMRTLTLVSPGSQHARFFSTLGEPIDDPTNPPQPSGPPDFERVQHVARECGMEFLPPPEA
jgi:quercetin dioxygenase-like cupin family protein